MSVCVSSLSRSHLFVDCHQIWHRGVNPKCKNEFVEGQYRTTPSPISLIKSPLLTQRSWKSMHVNNTISALNVQLSPKFSRHMWNRGRGTRWWRQIFWQEIRVGEHNGDVGFLSRNMAVSRMRWKNMHYLAFIDGRVATIPKSHSKCGSGNTTVTSELWPEVEIWPFRACAIKICNLARTCGWIAKITESYSKSGSGNSMATSNFWPEVEIWRFRAIKNMQFGPYLRPNRQNSCIL